MPAGLAEDTGVQRVPPTTLAEDTTRGNKTGVVWSLGVEVITTHDWFTGEVNTGIDDK